MNSRRYSKFRASIIASLILLSLLVSPAMAVSGDTIRISVDTSNVQVYDNLTPQLCNVWNLESDFQVFPNQENPNRDSCGNLNIWYFLSSTTLTRNPPYTLLPNFYNDANGVAGLEAWMGTATQEGYHSYTPDIWVNNTGNTWITPKGISFPPDMVFVHPAPNQQIIIGWRSPFDGQVSIRGFVSDMDPQGGDGILWYIDKGSTNLVSGSLPNGGAQDFNEGTGSNSLTNVSVVQGDFIYFIIHPKGEYQYDSTRLDVKITSPFLDLPFQYTNFQEATKGSNSGGYVNSWFDHTNPGYGNDDDNLTTWLGPYTGSVNIGRTNCNTPPGGFGISCYDAHDGIDFEHVSDEVLTAAPGKVWKKGYEENGFGNYLYIDHDNCYASFYAHLKNAPTLQVGDPVTDRQQVGIMGNTGLSIGGGGGVHLHFGLYYDPTCDGDFSDKIVVDPYGWSGAGLDPYTTGTSIYLWKYPYDFSRQSITSSGGSASTPSGNLAVTVPAGAVVNPITLELWNTPPVAGASATLRSSGNSFWMRVLEWLAGGGSPSLMASAATNSFDVPVTVTVNYDPSLMPHLDTNQLTIKQWDNVGLTWVTLPTTLDALNQQASAQTSQPGHFDMQAPLVCPADILEPNDNYDGSSIAQTDGTLVSNLFDIAQDEDWFKFNAVAGTQYAIQTKNLAAGVDTALEIYDTDGLTLLVSDDNSGGGNASSLIWQAPQDGLYFARVAQASGSSYGCSSTYNFMVLVDITAPTVNIFTVTTPTNTLNIPITAFTATDNIGVTGYLITESSTAPAAGAAGWTGTAPTTYTVASDGNYILYPWAKDAADNVSAVFASPPAVVVDTTAPSVTSITRVNASPTNLASVTFTVTFSESVIGVDMVGPLFDDFALTITGVTGASITNVSGSGSAYTITVNTGSGNGTIRLDIPVSATITDLAGNPLASLPYITGDEYIVTKVFNLFLPLILR